MTIWSDKRQNPAAFDAEPPPSREADLSPQFITFEAILPAAMALRAEENGAKRAAMDPLNLLVLSILGRRLYLVRCDFRDTVASAASVSLPKVAPRRCRGAAAVWRLSLAHWPRLFSRFAHGRHRRRGAVHRQQHDRHGLGERPRYHTRFADELGHRLISATASARSRPQHIMFITTQYSLAAARSASSLKHRTRARRP